MSIVIEQVEALPAVQRAGHKESEETRLIREAVMTQTPQRIADIPEGDAYNNLQQRIRSAAAKAGLKVTVRFSRTAEDTGDVYFQGFDENEVKPGPSDLAEANSGE